MVAIGFVAGRLVLTGAYLNYLKPGMKVWLLVSSGLLLLVGLALLGRAFFSPSHSSHDHPMTRASWLLLAPALALVVMPTDPLGSFAVDRRDIRQADVDTTPTFDALPEPVDGAFELSMREFNDRASLDRKRSLENKRVRLTGFVAPAASGSDASFVLSRFVILCCAADAYPVEVEIYGADAPPVDSWVVVEGEWRVPTGTFRPYVDLVSLDARKPVRTISRPENPYDPA
jgi:uncharacterized repeat protein (TIGR03943 family)